jgi:hypothetical protein
MISWPMPLFMLLAGASTWFALQRRSYGQYVGERVTRLLIPLIIGMLILIPPQVYFERLQRGQFLGSFLDFIPHAFDGGPYPEGNISAGQFWFIFYLFVYALVAIPIFYVLRGKTGKRWISWLASFCKYPGAIFIFAVPLIIGQLALGWRYPETHNPINDWMLHWQLFFVFIFGFVLYSDERFERAVEKNWVIALILAVLTSIGMLTLFQFGPAGAMDAVLGQGAYYFRKFTNIKVFYVLGSIAFRLNAWAWMILILALGVKYLRFTNKYLAYASRAAFPVFILHQTIIIMVAFYVIKQPWDILPKFLVILLVSFVITIGLYELVKRWSVTRFLFGVKPSPKPILEAPSISGKQIETP